ncbi:unnamed protein product [Calicophoron daubneyi]|uniref:RBR-type E3 ubiquitin transferase n=1 Tax=Calicophoron daubneyi TaxID=300641 RepID=A0AAV2T761_CALDB
MANNPSAEVGVDDEEDEDDDYYNYDDPDTYLDHERALLDKANLEAFSYKELEMDEVEGILNQDVDILCNSIEVPPSVARSLLLNHNWELENVKSRFLSDPIKLLVEQGMLPPRTASPTVSDSPAVTFTVQLAKRLDFPVQAYLSAPKIDLGGVCPICFCTPPQSISRIEFFPDYSGHHSDSKTPPSAAATAPIPSGEGEAPSTRLSRSSARSPCPSTTPDSGLSTSGLYGLSCGHRFCADCWLSYLSVQVEQGLSIEIKCMAVSCAITVAEDFLLTMLRGSPMKDKYLSFIFRRMVACHPSLQFCVGADCPVVIHALEPPKARRVSCSKCNAEFCFLCTEAYHAPASCEIMKRWLVKCRDDSGTASYMAAHTKDCPNCHVCIEKNGGCNHMQCTKCKHDFCWVCLEPWSLHQAQYYNCSRYDERSNPAKDQARELARESLKRYVFYYDRWANHERSLRLEEEHRDRVQARIQEKVMSKDGTWIDWQYLLTAADTLRNCRYTLKYTYPCAYFSEKLERKDLFEYQQALLESEVEELSWKIEHAEITDRAALQNAMDVCEKHRLTLLQEFMTD